VQGNRPSLARVLTGGWMGTLSCALALGIIAPVWAQVGIATVTHPAGIMTLQVEDPQIVTWQDAGTTTTPPQTHTWQRPGGRFRLLTGPTAPAGGDPTQSGDENRAVASVFAASAGPNNVPYSTFSSKTTLAVNGAYFDMHDLAAAAADVIGSNPVRSYFPSPCIVGSRDIYCEGRVPIDNANILLATQFVNVQHIFTLIHDTLRIEYIVTNNTTTAQTVGLRVVVDGQFDGGSSRDGTMVYLPSGKTIDSEKVIPDAEIKTIPNTWVTVDNPDNPKVFLRGTVQGTDVNDPGTADEAAGKPSRIGWGLYRNMSAGSGWTFTPNSVLALTGEDWGYMVQWDERLLGAGQSRRYVTYFGIGNSSADYNSPYALAAYSPSVLNVKAGDDPTTDETEAYYFTDNQGRSAFPVYAYADNFFPSPLLAASVRISLPTGLELDPPTQSMSKSLGTVARNEDKFVSWTVRATTGRPGPAVIKFTGPQSRVVERKVYIPALPILTALPSMRGLEMISIPYSFTNSDAEHVFSNLGSLYVGGPNALVRYNPEDNAYKFFPDPFVTNVEPGEGYWLLNQNRTTVYLPTDAAVLPTDRAYTSSIAAGWNQVGNPFTGPVNLSDVEVIDASGKQWTMTQAVGRSLILPTLFAYDAEANDYVWETELENVRLDPYAGYWLYAYENVSLVFPGPTLFAPTSAHAAPKAESSDGWKVPLTVAGAGKVRTNRCLGERAAASDGIDACDVMAPPACLSDGVSLRAAFVAPSGAQCMEDIRGTGTGTQEWKLAVETNAVDQPITVSWPDLSAMPADLVPVFVDDATGERRYMRTTSSYTYRSGASGGTRNFRVIVQPRDASRLMVKSAAVSAGAGAVSVVYQLSADAAVDVEIRNISGVPIKQLASGRISAAGANTLTWDGRSAQGVKVPTGRYLCKITARSPQTGEQHSLVRGFQLSR
jgi:hypothetical protein